MPPNTPRPTFFRAGGALGLAGLIFLLGLLAKLPAAHAWLHAALEPAREQCDHASQGAPDGAPHGDVGCAITLFAQGFLTPDLAPQVDPFQIPADALVPVWSSHPRPRPPARLHPPAHAPPVLG